jgi:hypothetical protein
MIKLRTRRVNKSNHTRLFTIAPDPEPLKLCIIVRQEISPESSQFERFHLDYPDQRMMRGISQKAQSSMLEPLL